MISTFKKLGFTILFTALSVVSLSAQSSAKWKIDKLHTSVNFSINHFFSAVTGKFTDFDGAMYFSPNNLKESQVNFTISVKSVDTDSKKRDKHLQSKDFFNAKDYPKMSFESNKFEKKSDKEYLIHGKLTIKNKTKNVILPMKITGQMEHPMRKGTMILGVVIDTKINRTNFDVGTGDWATTMVVGDEVKIHIPIELNRKK